MIRSITRQSTDPNMPPATLPTRNLGRTAMRPAALAMGGAWLGRVSDSDREAIDAVHRAFERGINLFDTDPGYCHGESEPRLGKALADLPRDQCYVSTKVGTRIGVRDDFSPETVKSSFQQSLDALGVDYVDLLMIHDPTDIDAALDGALDTLLSFKAQGLARHIGIGCRQHAFHQRAMQTGHMDVVLTFKDYTLLDQSALRDTIPTAMQRGCGLILASPLDMGALAGPEPDAEKRPRAHAMWRWCAERGVSLRTLALQFCLALPIEGCVMVGPASAEQVDGVLDAATAPIDETVWAEFEAAFGVQRCTDAGQTPPAPS